MNLFGKKKAPPPAAPTGPAANSTVQETGPAIAKLRDATETLEKREEHLYRKIDNEVKQAQAFSKAGKKKEALTCIKRKKMYEKQLDQIGNAKMTLETQKLALEQTNINREALEAQKTAVAAMKTATQSMGGVDAVEEMMDAVEDGLVDADEIGQALGRSVAMPGVDADEDDMLAELEALEQADLDQQLGAVNLGASSAADEEAELMRVMPSAPMPSAPTTAVKPAMTDEERELAELEASMAM